MAFSVLVPLLLSGCLFKKTTVHVRHFILSPTATNEPVATEPLSVGLAGVKMPAYLLRDSLSIRDGGTEVEFLEDARWGERLDLSFQRAVAANLAQLLPGGNVYSTEWIRSQVMARVSINVQQFDVDARGQGTLIVRWRITGPDNDTPLKSDTTRYERTGPSPRGNPEAIAATLSELTAEFSRELARAIHETSKIKP